MTEHVLTWHPKVPGELPAAEGSDEQLRLIGMPTGLVRPARQTLAADQLTAAARTRLHEITADLRARTEDPSAPPRRFSLADLDEADKATVADILGEGDVWAKVGVDNSYWRVVESVLAGVWRLEASAADGTTGEWIEVGAVPRPILEAAARLPRASINRAGEATTVETHGRHDPCVGIRATPIAEAMLALVLMDHALRQRAQCGDVSVATPPIAANSSN